MQIERFKSKCTKMAKKMVQHWENIVYLLNEKEKIDTFIKNLGYLKVQKYLPSYVKHGKDVENNYKGLHSMYMVSSHLLDIPNI